MIIYVSIKKCRFLLYLTEKKGIINAYTYKGKDR